MKDIYSDLWSFIINCVCLLILCSRIGFKSSYFELKGRNLQKTLMLPSPFIYKNVIIWKDEKKLKIMGKIK